MHMHFCLCLTSMCSTGVQLPLLIINCTLRPMPYALYKLFISTGPCTNWVTLAVLNHGKNEGCLTSARISSTKEGLLLPSSFFTTPEPRTSHPPQLSKYFCFLILIQPCVIHQEDEDTTNSYQSLTDAGASHYRRRVKGTLRPRQNDERPSIPTS